MKTFRTSVLRLTTAAAITGMLSATAMAEAIKFQDLAIGSTVTREGIDLGGVFSRDYFPVPDGEWTVISMKDDIIEKWGGSIGEMKFISLVLANKDKESNTPFFWVHFNPKTARIGIKFMPCENSKFAMVNDFKSQPSQFLYLCHFGYYLKGVNQKWVREVANNDKSDVTIREVMSVVQKNPDLLPEPTNFVVSQFSARLSNEYITNWRVYVKSNDPTLTTKTFVPGEPNYEAAAQWSQKFGEGLGNFLKGDRVVLPTLTAWPMSSAVKSAGNN